LLFDSKVSICFTNCWRKTQALKEITIAYLNKTCRCSWLFYSWCIWQSDIAPTGFSSFPNQLRLFSLLILDYLYLVRHFESMLPSY
jgi:hypothetical protein